MRIPRAGERVFVNEYEAVFMVVYTYNETQTADLLPVGSGPIKEDVPWRKLFRCWPLPVEQMNATPGWG